MHEHNSIGRLADSESFENGQKGTRTLFTVKFGALTAWLRDVTAIVLMWKAIAYLSRVAG